MKNRIIILALLLIFIPSIVFAESKDEFINDYGVRIPKQTYNALRKVYTEAALQVMTPTEYENIIDLDLDFDSTKSITKYYRSDYNLITGDYITEEIDKSEINLEASPKLSAFINTAYKALTLYVTPGTTNALISEDLIWLNFPSTRSYDVIGVRYPNASVVNGTQYGKQIYTQGGVTRTINYAYNGTNINNQQYGYGISMNLVDPTVTYLECMISNSISFSSGTHTVYGSYQHATSNVSLQTSKSYTIANNGLGGVFVFNNGYGSYYDNMSGVYITF